MHDKLLAEECKMYRQTGRQADRQAWLTYFTFMGGLRLAPIPLTPQHLINAENYLHSNFRLSFYELDHSQFFFNFNVACYEKYCIHKERKKYRCI